MSTKSNIEIDTVLGDITEERTDLIVNAANEGLQAGGGVCGAIFARAGRAELQAACDLIGRCPTGEACLTPAFGIPVKGIVHAVGPRYRDGKSGEAELLGSAWRSSLELADAHGFRSIAFPSISTGIYGYLLDEAATVVGNTLANYVASRNEGTGSVALIRIVLRDPDTQATYARAIELARGR